MIHVVFQPADAEVLKKAFELEPSMSGELLTVSDDFAVGPISEIFTEEGINNRKEWWKEVLREGDYDGSVESGSVNDQAVIESIVNRLNAEQNEVLWIWAAQNKHDVSGYYWLISQLKQFQGRVFILYLNNLPFINEKGSIFYPENLFEIPAREFLKAKKLARPVTLSEFEIDPDEWSRLQAEDKGVRILEGGKKLVQFDVDYYDEDLRKFIGRDWQKASRIIQQFLTKNKQTTGDAFLLWRLKLIIQHGGYDVQGTIRNMKEFEVKAMASQETVDA
jgi:hypothetical protein